MNQPSFLFFFKSVKLYPSFHTSLSSEKVTGIFHPLETVSYKEKSPFLYCVTSISIFTSTRADKRGGYSFSYPLFYLFFFEGPNFPSPPSSPSPEGRGHLIGSYLEEPSPSAGI